MSFLNYEKWTDSYLCNSFQHYFDLNCFDFHKRFWFKLLDSFLLHFASLKIGNDLVTEL